MSKLLKTVSTIVLCTFLVAITPTILKPDASSPNPIEFTTSSNSSFDLVNVNSSDSKDRVFVSKNNEGFDTRLVVDSKEVDLKKQGYENSCGVKVETSTEKIIGNQYLKVNFIFTNLTQDLKTFDFSNCFKIGEGSQVVSNDNIFSFKNGDRSFIFYLKNHFGVNDVNNFWIGDSKDNNSNFESQVKSDSKFVSDGNLDALFTWSQKSLQPNEKKTLSFLVSSNQLEDLPNVTFNSLTSNEVVIGDSLNVTGSVSSNDKENVSFMYSFDDSSKEYKTNSGIQCYGQTKEFNVGINVPSDLNSGKHELHVWFEDSRGNTSVSKTYDVNLIDKTQPDFKEVKDTTKINNKVNLTIEDTGSGVDKVVLPNGQEIKNKDSSNEMNVKYETSSNGNLEFKAVDGSGNESLKTVKVSNYSARKEKDEDLKFCQKMMNSPKLQYLKVDSPSVVSLSNSPENDSWTPIDYTQSSNKNLSQTDLNLMHEDNWLNRLVVEHSKSGFADNSSSYNVGGSKSGHSLSQLDLNDFLSITQLGSTDSTISSIPKSVKFLSNLTSFKLSGTQTSELPREMGNLANLTYLNLDNNVIVELPNWFTNFTKLKTLSVNHNRIYKIPQPFASDKNVNVLAQYNFLTTDYGRAVQYRGYYYNYMQSNGGTSSVNQFALSLIIRQRVVLTLGELTKPFKKYLLEKRVTGYKANAIYGIKLLSTDESVVDNEGNVLDSGECNIKVYIPNDVGDNAWNTQNVKVSINGNINPKLSLVNSEPCKETQIKCDLSDSLGYGKVILPDGTESTDNIVYYKVTSNGTYEFKAYDKVGNETTKSIEVTNLDSTPPTGSLSLSTDEFVSSVDINYSGDDDNWDHVVLPNGQSTTSKTGSYTVNYSGTYKFEFWDKAGNKTEKSIDVTNIQTIVLTTSSNSIDFGSSSDPREQSIKFSVKSSGSYNIKIQTLTDLDNNGSLLPPSQVQYKFGNLNFIGLPDKLNINELCSNEPANSLSPKDYSLDFRLGLISYGSKSGVYNIKFKLSVSQN